MRCDFNSIKVQLKQYPAEGIGSIYTHFNSIKVQLKLATTFAPEFLAHIFQFHKGTIKAARIPYKDYLYRYFNSIKVQLKHSNESEVNSKRFNFNSIKVQLKLQAPTDNVASAAYFNSIKVQLKPRLGLAHGLHSAISIP